MTKHTLPHANTQESHKAPVRGREGAQPPRLNAKTRHAIDLLVTTGRNQREAAEVAGMSEKSLSRALHKPHIADYYERQKVLALQDLKQVRKLGEVAALRVAIDLLHNSKSDSVRARMVEFFGRIEQSGPSVVIQNNINSTGYETVRPGQRVVDIIDATHSKGSKQRDPAPDHAATDSQSVSRDDQTPIE